MHTLQFFCNIHAEFNKIGYIFRKKHLFSSHEPQLWIFLTIALPGSYLSALGRVLLAKVACHALSARFSAS